MKNKNETQRERLQNTLAWMQGIQRQLLFSRELQVSTALLYCVWDDPEDPGLVPDDCWSVVLNIQYGHNQIKSFDFDATASPEETAAIKESAIAFFGEHGIIID